MLWNVLLVVGTTYCALCVLLYFFQPRLIFFPQIGRYDYVTPVQAGMAFESVKIAVADTELDAWWVPARGPRGAVLFFHGNAGNISHRLDYLRLFNRLGFSTLIFDYRGFGKSGGELSEAGMYQDAEAAWRYLTQTRQVAPASVVLFGESLGGAVAAHLAAQVKPRALILTSTFTSLPELGAKLYPLFPVRLLSRFKYDTREYLREVSCPVLIVHSRDDEIVPFAQGEALYSAAHEPKRFLEIFGGHNTGLMASEQIWFKGVQDFFNSLESKVP
ncbi:MAG TPA: alpha/beta hydrolase [Burkholderiales bacterium]|nr:alpha/beta hydrolase [Burkholderiales bacterium]